VTLLVLTVLMTLNYVDRQVINILAEPIKRELLISDTQLGLLTGLAFALFFAVVGLPLARLAERTNRVRIITISAAVWSLFTAAGGLAVGFPFLLATRMGVAVGEGGLAGPANALICDLFPRGRRAAAIARFYLGIPLGGLLGLSLGGVVGTAFGWRAALIGLGLPGLIIAGLAALVLRDPRKERMVADTSSRQPYRQVLRHLLSKRTYVLCALASAISSFLNNGKIAFVSAFFFRVHGDGLPALAQWCASRTGVTIAPRALVGVGLGLVLGLGGLVGTWLGGRLADILARHSARAFMLIPAAATVLCAPLYWLVFQLSSAGAALLLLFAPTVLGYMFYGPMHATLQSLVRPAIRPTSTALHLFIVALLGVGGLPVALGALSDHFAVTQGSAEGLRSALEWMIPAVAVVGGGLFLTGSFTILRELESWNATPAVKEV